MAAPQGLSRLLRFAAIVACFGVMTVIMHSLGFGGADFLPPEHIRSRPNDRCAYHTCQAPSTGLYKTKVLDATRQEYRRTITYYKERDLPLCNQPALYSPGPT
jgi:hypothetical protein